MPVYVNGAARGSCRPDIRTSSSRRGRRRCKAADVILIFGTPLDFRIGYGRESHINAGAKLIQVDLDGGELGRNRGCDVGIIGDTGMVMAQLTELAEAEGYQPSLAKPWLDRAPQERERQVASRCSPSWLGRGADRSAARLQGDRCGRSTTTRSSSVTAATSSPPRRTPCAAREARPVARSRSARHARRRPRLRDGGEAREPEVATS